MIWNYFKIAWRNLIQNKSYSTINIGGLAIGMASSIFILLWVNNEISYDRFHSNANEIYRLTADAGNGFKAAVSPAGMVAQLPDEIPEIESFVRLSLPFESLFEVDNKNFKIESVIFADENFLDVFSFPLIAGDAKVALANPDGMLITEATSKQFFGNESALGKVVKVNNSDSFTVTGVLANTPSNSHLQFNIILPMAFQAKTNNDLINNVWDNFNFYGYFKFNKEAVLSPETISNTIEKINEIFKDRVNEFEIIFNLQPLTDIHLHSDLQIDLPGRGNVQYVNIFIIVAFIILIVACINYMNLATAQSSKRAKEVGLRKVIGAQRKQLIFQFLSESLILSFCALVIAIGIVYLFLPAFNNLAQKELIFNLWDKRIWMSLLAIFLVTGFLSGSYPALFLSNFKPISVLKGKVKLASYNLFFRNGLIVTQFAASVLLLISTAVVYNQLNFIKNKNLGFDKENLLYVPMEGEIQKKQDALKIALQQNPLTSNFSLVSELPTNLASGTFNVDWDGKDPNEQILFPNIAVDENFIDVFKIEVLNGRGFSKELSTDRTSFLVNETAVKTMGMTVDNAVGKRLTFQEREGTIIGVVKDFNYKHLQYEIEPLVLESNSGRGNVVVRLAANSAERTISALEEVYTTINPSYPFEYNFIDADLDAQYKGEKQMEVVFNLFAILAIFISCLGLYGLSAFMAEQRFKEIGVRKVLGASVLKLVNMLSWDLLKLVLVSFLIALPFAWYIMNLWLQGFAFHINISWSIFILAGVAVLFVAIATVSYQSIRAANANPIKSLRTE